MSEANANPAAQANSPHWSAGDAVPLGKEASRFSLHRLREANPKTVPLLIGTAVAATAFAHYGVAPLLKTLHAGRFDEIAAGVAVALSSIWLASSVRSLHHRRQAAATVDHAAEKLIEAGATRKDVKRSATGQDEETRAFARLVSERMLEKRVAAKKAEEAAPVAKKARRFGR